MNSTEKETSSEFIQQETPRCMISTLVEAKLSTRSCIKPSTQMRFLATLEPMLNRALIPSNQNRTFSNQCHKHLRKAQGMDFIQLVDRELDSLSQIQSSFSMRIAEWQMITRIRHHMHLATPEIMPNTEAIVRIQAIWMECKSETPSNIMPWTSPSQPPMPIQWTAPILMGSRKTSRAPRKNYHQPVNSSNKTPSHRRSSPLK